MVWTDDCHGFELNLEVRVDVIVLEIVFLKSGKINVFAATTDSLNVRPR